MNISIYGSMYRSIYWRSWKTWLIGVAAVGVLFGIWWRIQTPHAPDERQQAIERSGTPAGMVYVPGGDCLLGTDDPDADEDVRPLRHLFVPSFYIGRTEVTNAEFQRFDPKHTFPANEAPLPATNITYDQAEAYARWAGKRLPTEAEWEKAARGTDGRRYPWGNNWDARKVATRAHRSGQPAEPVAKSMTSGTKGKSLAQCRIGSSRVQPVGGVPGGVSPYGCLDMAGNAWEWVQGFYNGNSEMRLLKGGAVGYGERDMRTYNHAIEGSAAT